MSSYQPYSTVQAVEHIVPGVQTHIRPVQQMVQQIEMVPYQQVMQQVELVQHQPHIHVVRQGLSYADSEAPVFPRIRERERDAERQRPPRDRERERAAPPPPEDEPEPITIVKDVYIERAVQVPKEVAVERMVEAAVEKAVFKDVGVPVDKIAVQDIQIPVERIILHEKKIDLEVQTLNHSELTDFDDSQVPVSVDRVLIEEKEVQLDRFLERMVEVPVEKAVVQEVGVMVDKIVTIEKRIPVDKIVFVENFIEIPVEKIVEKVNFLEWPVEHVTYKEVPVEVDRLVERVVVKEIDVPVRVKVPVPVESIAEKTVIVEVPVIKEVPTEVVKIVENIVVQEVPVERVIHREIAKDGEVEIQRLKSEILRYQGLLGEPSGREVREVREVVRERSALPQASVQNEVYQFSAYSTTNVNDRNTANFNKTILSEQSFESSSRTLRNVGLGLHLIRNDQSLKTWVEDIIPGFAADKNGILQVGDIVIAIDGEEVDQFNLEGIKNRTIGPEGSSCTLQMLRGNRYFTVTLERILPDVQKE